MRNSQRDSQGSFTAGTPLARPGWAGRVRQQFASAGLGFVCRVRLLFSARMSKRGA